MDITYTVEQKPLTANKIRTYHYHKVATNMRAWKESFYWLHKQNPHVFDTPIVVTVTHETKGRLPDVGSCMHTVKAAIDGLVLAGMIPDDNPKWLHAITFLAPKKTGRDALSLTIEKASNAGNSSS